MAITANDMKIMASARMVDAADGGGQMSGTTVQDGVDNNVFPDVSSTDRAFGRLQLRKLWPTVRSNDTDTLLGAHMILDDVPDDPNVQAWMVIGASASETRADVLARLETPLWEQQHAARLPGLQWSTAPRLRQRIKVPSGGFMPQPGMALSASYAAAASTYHSTPVFITSVTAIAGDDPTRSEGFTGLVGTDTIVAVTYEGSFVFPQTSPDPAAVAYDVFACSPSITAPRVATTRDVTGTLSIGATFCDVNTVLAQVVPRAWGAPHGSSTQVGIDSAAIGLGGAVPAFRQGDGLVIHHTGSLSPATYANGNSFDCGRTNLSGVRLIGANGVAITTGWTVDLATGIGSITNISGWSQPVTVRHTIEEVLACARTGYGEADGGSRGSGVNLTTAPFALSLGLMMYSGQTNVGSIRVISKTGQDITNLSELPNGFGRYFVIDLAAGTATFQASSTASANAFIASHSPVRLVSGGVYAAPSTTTLPQLPLHRITFNRALTRAFPAGSKVSSMLFLGDFQARAGAPFSQQAWTSIWADSRIGDPILPQYNTAANPIVVNNNGAVTERWAFIFLTSTTFRLIGETLGEVATGDVNTAFSPINPSTGTPYFTIAAEGWGTWAGGNVLRLNTYGPNAPVWGARATLPSAPGGSDSATFALRGDVNT